MTNTKQNRTAQADLTLSENTEQMKGGMRNMNSNTENSEAHVGLQRMVSRRDALSRVIDNVRDTFYLNANSYNSKLPKKWVELDDEGHRSRMLPEYDFYNVWYQGEGESRDLDQETAMNVQAATNRYYGGSLSRRTTREDYEKNLVDAINESSNYEVEKVKQEEKENIRRKRYIAIRYNLLAESLATPYMDRAPSTPKLWAPKEIDDWNWEIVRDKVLKPTNDQDDSAQGEKD